MIYLDTADKEDIKAAVRDPITVSVPDIDFDRINSYGLNFTSAVIPKRIRGSSFTAVLSPAEP